MSEFSKLFHERIGLSQGQNITLDSLDRVLEKTAQSIPFENICIINRKTSEISKVNLVDKILIRREGEPVMN